MRELHYNFVSSMSGRIVFQTSDKGENYWPIVFVEAWVQPDNFSMADDTELKNLIKVVETGL